MGYFFAFSAMYHVYILRNGAGIYYKGFAEGLERRLFQHNLDLGRYTREKGP